MLRLWSHSWQPVKKSFIDLVNEKYLSAPSFQHSSVFGGEWRASEHLQDGVCVCTDKLENFSWLMSSEENTW